MVWTQLWISMVAIFTTIWGVNGIYIVDFLQNSESYNSEYFVKHILNELVEKKLKFRVNQNKKKLVTFL